MDERGDKKPRYPAPFSLRLTDDERQELERLCEGLPWGQYIRDLIFEESRRPRTRGRSPVKDHKLLAKLLGQLGKSRLSQNINQLAKAANSGSLPVTPDVKKALMEAAGAIKAMREMLIRALGLKAQQDDEHTGEDRNGDGP